MNFELIAHPSPEDLGRYSGVDSLAVHVDESAIFSKGDMILYNAFTSIGGMGAIRDKTNGKTARRYVAEL